MVVLLLLTFVLLLDGLSAYPKRSPTNNLRIFGGENATEGQFPYMAAVYLGSEFFAAASIIGKQWLLTPDLLNIAVKSLKVTVGITSLSQTNGQTLEVANMFRLGKFPLDSIGLLRLKTEIKLSNFVKVIGLPTKDIGGNVSVTISGWGDIAPDTKSDNLQYIKVMTMTNKECNDSFAIINKAIVDTDVCTIAKWNVGICIGDYGNPVVAENVQVGITFGGIPCARGFPDVSTRVFSYVEQIRKIIGE